MTANTAQPKLVELAPGTCFKGYEIIRELGHGAMAVVYLARQKGLDRLVALKVMRVDHEVESGQEFLERFKNEIKTTAALSHASIVKAYEAGSLEGELFYFAMEYVDGESLQAILERAGHLPIPQCLEYMLAVAHALNYGWQRQGLTHGDLKPENIMVSRNGEIKIADFGLATVRGHTFQGYNLMLTPHYAAPEILRRKRDVHDCRADIYAFGATMYHLLSGSTPFPGNDIQEVMRRQMNDPLEPLCSRSSEIPGWLSDFVSTLMAKEASSRPDNWQAVIVGLQACLDRSREKTARKGFQMEITAGDGQRRYPAAGPGLVHKQQNRITLLLILLLSFAVLASYYVIRIISSERQIAELTNTSELNNVEEPPLPEVKTETAADIIEPAEEGPGTEPIAEEELLNKIAGARPGGGRPVAGQAEANDSAAIAEDEETSDDRPNDNLMTSDNVMWANLAAAGFWNQADFSQYNCVRLSCFLAYCLGRDWQDENLERYLRQLETWKMIGSCRRREADLLDFIRNSFLQRLDESFLKLQLHRERLEGRKFSSALPDKPSFKVVSVAFDGMEAEFSFADKGTMQKIYTWKELAKDGYLDGMMKHGLTGPEESTADLQSYVAYCLWQKKFGPETDQAIARLGARGNALQWKNFAELLKLSCQENIALLASELEKAFLEIKHGASFQAGRRVQNLRQTSDGREVDLKEPVERLQTFLQLESPEQFGRQLLAEGQACQFDNPGKAYAAFLTVKNRYGGDYPEFSSVDKMLEQVYRKMAIDGPGLKTVNVEFDSCWPFLDISGDSSRLPLAAVIRNQRYALQEKNGDERNNMLELQRCCLAISQCDWSEYKHFVAVSGRIRQRGSEECQLAREIAQGWIDWRTGKENLVAPRGLNLLRLSKHEDSSEKCWLYRRRGLELILLGGGEEKATAKAVAGWEKEESLWLLSDEFVTNLLLELVWITRNTGGNEAAVNVLERARTAMEAHRTAEKKWEKLELGLTWQWKILNGDEIIWQELPANRMAGVEILFSFWSSLTPVSAGAWQERDVQDFLKENAAGWQILGGRAIYGWLLNQFVALLPEYASGQPRQLVEKVSSWNLPCLNQHYVSLQMLRAGCLELEGKVALPNAQTVLKASPCAIPAERNMLVLADWQPDWEKMHRQAGTPEVVFLVEWLNNCFAFRNEKSYLTRQDILEGLKPEERRILEIAAEL